jgi:hypothetical protein
MKKKKRTKKKAPSRWQRFKEEFRWPEIGSITVFFAILMIIALAWLLGAWYLMTYHYYTGNETKAGQLGDTFGVLNSLFAGFAFAGLVYTILLQRKELKETRAEFKQQNVTLRLQRFENTFFNLLSARNGLIGTLKGPNTTQSNDPLIIHYGRDLISKINEEIRARVKMFDIKQQNNLAENIRKMVELFALSITGFENSVDLYVSSLHSILKLIRDSELFETYAQREFYYAIVRSQLNFEERRFIYYYMSIGNPLTATGKYLYELRESEIEFKFNEFTPEFLFHPSHVELQGSWDGFLNYEDEDAYWDDDPYT